MKRLLYLVVFLLVALCGQSQTINQKGVTYRYNGKKQRTPIGGVYIKPVTANNGVVSDESNGTFTLVLNSLQMGSRIGNVRVTKQGMMVFNQQAVDEWNVRKEPLCLILCDADEFQRQKKNLIAIGESQAKKKYDKKLAELKKQNEAKQLKIDEYYNRLDSLEKEYQNALKHMDEYADVFARIDESEVDTVAQRAIELFHHGEIEESLRLFEKGNYMKRLTKALDTKARALKLRQVADTVEALANKDVKKHVNTIKAQVAVYKVNNDFKQAGELLKGLADNTKTLEDIWEYAFFIDNQNNLSEALKYYQTYIDKMGKDLVLDDKTRRRQKARAHNNIGRIYWLMYKYEEAEAAYNMSLNCNRGIDGIFADSMRYAYTLANIAILLKDKYEYDKAESYYIQSHNLYKNLSNVPMKDRLYYEALLANNIGNLYRIIKRIDDSERMFKAAVDLYNRLEQFTKDYIYERARTERNLADLYLVTKRYTESEKWYQYALKTCRTLVATNASAYEDQLAATLQRFAGLYWETQRYDESENLYKQALEIYKKRTLANPLEFESAVAASQIGLAGVYQQTEQYDVCERLLTSSLEIYQRLAAVTPSLYLPLLATTQTRLGNLYRTMQKYVDAESLLMSALKIRERLFEEHPTVYEESLGESRGNLAVLFQECKRYAECDSMYRHALENYTHLATLAPSMYEDKVIGIQMCLAWLYDMMEDYPKAEAMWKSCIQSLEPHKNDSIETYDNQLAICYIAVAELYGKLQRIDESENWYKQGMKAYQYLAERFHSGYDAEVARTMILLAHLYSDNKRYAEGETMYKSALDIYKSLAKSNSSNYASKVAKTQYYLSLLYWVTDRYADCAALCHACINSYIPLYDISPKKYRKALADCYWWMGFSKSHMKDDDGAIQSFQESLRLAREMLKNGQDTSLHLNNLYGLSISYSHQKNYALAYQYNTELIAFIKNSRTEAWKNKYAEILVSRSFYANLLGKFNEGEQYSLEAIKVNSTNHIAYSNLAAALLFQGRVEEAENLYRQYKAEFKEGFLEDFSEYERLNVIPEERKKDVERIKAMLKE